MAAEFFMSHVEEDEHGVCQGGGGDVKKHGIDGCENEWRDIFTCVVTGPEFPLGASAMGAAAGLCLVNSNATRRHHGAAAGNTVLCCCIINKSSVLDHLNCSL